MTYNERIEGPIFYNLRGNQGVAQQNPEQCRNGACVESGQDDEPC